MPKWGHRNRGKKIKGNRTRHFIERIRLNGTICWEKDLREGRQGWGVIWIGYRSYGDNKRLKHECRKPGDQKRGVGHKSMERVSNRLIRKFRDRWCGTHARKHKTTRSAHSQGGDCLTRWYETHVPREDRFPREEAGKGGGPREEADDECDEDAAEERRHDEDGVDQHGGNPPRWHSGVSTTHL